MGTAYIKPRQARKNAKSLPAATRMLLTAALKKGGSYRSVAKLFRLSHHMQVPRMLTGEIGETPEMRAVRLRYETRARRIFMLDNRPRENSGDIENLRKIVREIEELVAVLKRSL
jgi:hypothetical protein